MPAGGCDKHPSVPPQDPPWKIYRAETPSRREPKFSYSAPLPLCARFYPHSRFSPGLQNRPHPQPPNAFPHAHLTQPVNAPTPRQSPSPTPTALCHKARGYAVPGVTPSSCPITFPTPNGVVPPPLRGNPPPLRQRRYAIKPGVTPSPALPRVQAQSRSLPRTGLCRRACWGVRQTSIRAPPRPPMENLSRGDAEPQRAQVLLLSASASLREILSPFPLFAGLTKSTPPPTAQRLPARSPHPTGQRPHSEAIPLPYANGVMP